MQEKNKILSKLEEFINNLQRPDFDHLALCVVKANEYINAEKFLRAEYDKRINTFAVFRETHSGKEAISGYLDCVKKILIKANLHNLHDLYFVETINSIYENMDKSPISINTNSQSTLTHYARYLTRLPLDDNNFYGIFNFYNKVLDYSSEVERAHNGEYENLFGVFEETDAVIRDKMTSLLDFYVYEQCQKKITNIPAAADAYKRVMKITLLNVLLELKIFIKQSQNGACVEALVDGKKQRHSSNLSGEEIEILRLRKILSPNNNYEQIGARLSPPLEGNNVKQKSQNIRNKLGAKTIDEALRFYEDRANKL